MIPAERFILEHGPLVLINLPARKDRRGEFGDQLRRIGLDFDHPAIRVFPAIRPTELAGFPTLGARGCFLSHRTVLEQVVASGAKSVIICEDDLDFAPDFIARIPAVLDILQSEMWDIFYAGYTSSRVGVLVSPETNMFRLPPDHPVICSHFYIIRGQAIAELHDYLGAILLRPYGHSDGGPMHYDGAITHFRRDRPDRLTLGILPTLGSQRSSRTDVHALRWFDKTPLVRGAIQLARKVRRR